VESLQIKIKYSLNKICFTNLAIHDRKGASVTVPKRPQGGSERRICVAARASLLACFAFSQKRLAHGTLEQ